MSAVPLLLVSLVASGNSSSGLVVLPPETRRAARDQAQELGAAALRGDAEAQLKRMHPKLIQGLGGHDAALEFIRRQPAEMKKEGALLLSMDAKEPTACARAAKQLQCLLPEIMVAAIQGGRLRSESELLAVSYDEGKTWFFIDAHNPEDLRRLLPEVSKLLPLHGRKKPEFFPGTK